MNKYFNIAIAVIFGLAIALGLLQWRYNPSSITQSEINRQNIQPQNPMTTGVETEAVPVEVSFLAVGDIMLSRNVAGVIAKNGKDGLFPFRKLDTLLSSTDFNFGNLESPYSGRDGYDPTGSLVFNAPTWTVSGLTQYNFKVLNLANNHAMDQGKDALTYTRKFLANHSIKPIGVGENLDEAWQGDIFTTKGIAIGFIGASYSSNNDNGATTNNFVARIEDIPRMQASIAAMKARTDFVVVTMHAGAEYTRAPNQDQIDFAHAAIDAGADIIIGAHPHWIQTTEEYKGKHIFYSLGNFVFDQEWSRDTKEGLTLKITLAKSVLCATDPNLLSRSLQQTVQCGIPTEARLSTIEFIPVIVENYSTPRLAAEQEKKIILKKIGVTTSVITP